MSVKEMGSEEPHGMGGWELDVPKVAGVCRGRTGEGQPLTTTSNCLFNKLFLEKGRALLYQIMSEKWADHYAFFVKQVVLPVISCTVNLTSNHFLGIVKGYNDSCYENCYY